MCALLSSHSQIRQRGYITRQPMLAAPIEFACLGLQGKAIGRPVYEILGGKVRDEIEVAAYVFFRYANSEIALSKVKPPAEVVNFTQHLVARYGFRTIKLKEGVFKPQHELACLQALREAFPLPECQLRYNPNAILSPATAIQLAQQLAPLNLE